MAAWGPVTQSSRNTRPPPTSGQQIPKARTRPRISTGRSGWATHSDISSDSFSCGCSAVLTTGRSPEELSIPRAPDQDISIDGRLHGRLLYAAYALPRWRKAWHGNLADRNRVVLWIFSTNGPDQRFRVSIRDKLSRLPLSELAKGGGLSFLLATGTVGLSNFIFHVVISRLLGPDQYGALGALLNVVLVLGVPLGAVQAAVTRTVALRGRAPIHLRTIANRAIVAGVISTVVLAGLSPVIAGFLHLGSVTPVLMLALLLVPSVIGAVLQGMLIGKQQFTPFAVAVVLVEAGLGVTGAMLATVASAAVTVGIVAWPLRR